MTRVILLLILLVIVPTVCLVWFMGAALKNSQLALREELVQLYRDRLRSLGPFDINVPETLEAGAAGRVLYEKQDCVYPLLYVDPLDTSQTAAFETAMALEQQDQDWQQALDLYRAVTTDSSIPHVVYEGTLGQIRCLRALNYLDEAMALSRTLAFVEDQAGPTFTPNQSAHACLLLVELAVEVDAHEVFEPCLRTAMESVGVATETRAFVLDRMVALIQQADAASALKKDVQEAVTHAQWCHMSVAAADHFHDVATRVAWEPGVLHAAVFNQVKVYGLSVQTGDRWALSLVSEEVLYAQLAECLTGLSDAKVFCRVLDRAGDVLGQHEVSDGVFHTEAMTGLFDGWTLALGFNEGVFSELAVRQRQIYVWTVVLVVSLTGLLGGVVVITLNREMTMSRLKNDFIATVTHELKTPLASTRLLVETLLEEQCSDPVRVQEYLGLIASENRRLGSLIDNFLTFSRMERNKHVFDRQKIPVQVCVQAACEAMQTRMQDVGCAFTCHVAEGLPEISVDEAAFVTVLVNLLDNALKYTGENKTVRMEAFQEGDRVCFKVTDNGIGMTVRQAKRVFDRFYQADTSLTRDTQGCGLGLAIVKYIVQAHDGQVTVESSSGRGSVFTVKMPAS